MTLQCEGKTLWARCASDDGTVAEFQPDPEGTPKLFITINYAEEDQVCTLILPMGEAMMLAQWLIAAAKGELPE